MVKVVKYAKLSLRKETKVGDTKDNASLNWSCRNGFPRITVYTSGNIKRGDSNELDYSKIIIAPFDHITLSSFLNMCEEVLHSDTEIRREVECYNTKFVNGSRLDEVYLQAKVIIGRDKLGIYYIAAVEEEKPKVKFELLPSTKFFRFVTENSEEVSNISRHYANAYIGLLRKCIERDVVDSIVVTEFEEKHKKNTKPTPPKNDIDITEDIPF